MLRRKRSYSRNNGNWQFYPNGRRLFDSKQKEKNTIVFKIKKIFFEVSSARAFCLCA